MYQHIVYQQVGQYTIGSWICSKLYMVGVHNNYLSSILMYMYIHVVKQAIICLT